MSAHALYGIAVFHNIGDVLSVTPIARQLKSDDPTCRVVYYTSHAGKVVLEGNTDLDEIVVLDGDPIELDRSIPALERSRPWTRFFTPAAYMNYEAIPGGSLYYLRGSIFGLVKAGAKLHWTVPFVFPFRLSAEEKAKAAAFCAGLPPGKRILMETDYRSQQSPWEDSWVVDVARECHRFSPVFIFTSREKPRFFDAFQRHYPKCVWCDLPFRLNAELFNLVDGYIGVSSGISCLTYSDYCRTDLPRIEVTRGEHWGAADLPHHRNLFLCYSKQRFTHALKHFAALVEEREVTPDFSLPSRVSPHGCRHCGAESIQPHHLPGLLRCEQCQAVYRSEPVPSGSSRVTINSVNTRVEAQSLAEFWRSVPREARDDTVNISGQLGDVEDLQALFERIQYQLKELGTLTVSTENLEGLVASRQGSQWAPLSDQRRIWYFSPRFLKETLIQAGFVITSERIVTPPFDRPALNAVISAAQPGASAETIEFLAGEVDRQGRGSMVEITARKRGGYKGRISLGPELSKLEPERLGDEMTPLRPTAESVLFVIPNRGRIPRLMETLRSLIAQSVSNWSAVVVSDGNSPADLAELRAGLSQLSDHRIQLVESDGAGPDGARDLGARPADSPWLVFLDSDDTVSPNFLSAMLDAARGNPSASVITSHAVQNGAASRVLEFAPPDDKSIRSGYPYPTACLVKREVWLKMDGCLHGLPAGSFAHHLWLSVLKQQLVIASIPTPILSLFVGDNSQLYHLAHRNWRVRLAMVRLLHHELFSEDEIQQASLTLRALPDALLAELRQTTHRSPTLPIPHLFLALHYEGNGMFTRAQAEYDSFLRLRSTRFDRLCDLLSIERRARGNAVDPLRMAGGAESSHREAAIREPAVTVSCSDQRERAEHVER